jgi:hypothetical protein
MACNPRWFVVVAVEGVLAVLGLERVDVDGAVRRLGRDKLVQRVPGDALDIMAVLGDLADKGSFKLLLTNGSRNTKDATSRGGGGGGGGGGGLHRTCSRIIDTCNIIHATDNKEGSIGGPGEVVYLCSGGSTHVLRPPCFLILEAIGAKTGREMVLGGNP